MLHPQRGQRLHGFTLIELLVVVAVIAILMAILMPALSSARTQARTIACGANLRSIGQAVAVYNTEYNGSMPLALYLGPHTETGGALGTYGRAGDNWVAFLWPSLNGSDGRYAPNDQRLPGWSTFESKVLLCPERMFEPPLNVGLNDAAGRYIRLSYAMSYWMHSDYNALANFSNGTAWQYHPAYSKTPRKLTAFEAPGSTAIGADVDSRRNQLSLWFGYIPDVPQAGFRHGRALQANFLFVDGHIEPLTSANAAGAKLRFKP